MNSMVINNKKRNMVTKEILKRYAWSTLVTFAAGFAMAVAPLLGEDLTLEAVKNGALVGVLLSGVRLGVKTVFELFLAQYFGEKK